LANERISETCPHCQNHDTLSVHVFQRYAHIFWIPFFPIGKTGASQCSHCKQVLKPTQMPAGVRLAYDNVAARAKMPYWTFAGVVVFGVLIILAILMDGK
jgi:phage terminase large subunit GpA-like protein